MRDERRQPRSDGFNVVFTRARQQVFAVQRGVYASSSQLRGDVLLDVLGLAFFHHQHRSFALAKVNDLVRHQRVGDVQHQHRYVAFAESIRQPQQLQAAQQAIVQTALHDQAQIRVLIARHQLVQTVLDDVLTCRRNAFFELALFLLEGDRRMRQAHVIKLRRFGHEVAGRHRRCAVGFGDKAAAHMAGAYA